MRAEGHVPEAHRGKPAPSEFLLIALFLQAQRGVTVDDESLHEPGFEKALGSFQLLSPRAEEDNLPIVEVRKVNGESPLI
jgi:hypothetical protein